MQTRLQRLCVALRAGTSKNEDTWCEVLGDFRSRIRFSSESIQRAVIRVAFHTILTAIPIFSARIGTTMVPG